MNLPRRRRHPRSAVMALAMLAASAGAAAAQTLHMEASGTSLAIEAPCARTVTIEPDPALSGHVVLEATAQHPEETAQLVFDSAPSAKLHVPHGKCWSPDGTDDLNPTMTIALRVPPDMALSISESGGAEYKLGALTGALTLEISGGVKFSAASIGAMTLDLSGGGTLAIGQIHGPVKADLSGGGDIQIEHATIPDLSISISGGGHFKLGGGQVDRLTIEMSGAGAVHLGATVGDATVALSGVGDVRLAKVTGRLTKDVEGVGSVTVGGE